MYRNIYKYDKIMKKKKQRSIKDTIQDNGSL